MDSIHVLVIRFLLYFNYAYMTLTFLRKMFLCDVKLATPLLMSIFLDASAILLYVGPSVCTYKETRVPLNEFSGGVLIQSSNAFKFWLNSSYKQNDGTRFFYEFTP